MLARRFFSLKDIDLLFHIYGCVSYLYKFASVWLLMVFSVSRKFVNFVHKSFHSSTSVLVYCFLMTWHSPKYKHIFPIMPNCKHSLSNTPKHVIMHIRHSKHQDAPKQMFNNKVTRTRALKTTMKQQRTQHIWIHHAFAMQLGSRFTLRLYKLDRPPTVADRPPTARTCPISDFWSNFVCFVFKTHWWNF